MIDALIEELKFNRNAGLKLLEKTRSFKVKTPLKNIEKEIHAIIVTFKLLLTFQNKIEEGEKKILALDQNNEYLNKSVYPRQEIPFNLLKLCLLIHKKSKKAFQKTQDKKFNEQTSFYFNKHNELFKKYDELLKEEPVFKKIKQTPVAVSMLNTKLVVAETLPPVVPQKKLLVEKINENSSDVSESKESDIEQSDLAKQRSLINENYVSRKEQIWENRQAIFNYRQSSELTLFKSSKPRNYNPGSYMLNRSLSCDSFFEPEKDDYEKLMKKGYGR